MADTITQLVNDAEKYLLVIIAGVSFNTWYKVTATESLVSTVSVVFVGLSLVFFSFALVTRETEHHVGLDDA